MDCTSLTADSLDRAAIDPDRAHLNITDSGNERVQVFALASVAIVRDLLRRVLGRAPLGDAVPQNLAPGRRRDRHHTTRGGAAGRTQGDQLLQEGRPTGAGRRREHERLRLRLVQGMPHLHPSCVQWQQLLVANTPCTVRAFDA